MLVFERSCGCAAVGNQNFETPKTEKLSFAALTNRLDYLSWLSNTSEKNWDGSMQNFISCRIFKILGVGKEEAGPVIRFSLNQVTDVSLRPITDDQFRASRLHRIWSANNHGKCLWWKKGSASISSPPSITNPGRHECEKNSLAILGLTPCYIALDSVAKLRPFSSELYA